MLDVTRPETPPAERPEAALLDEVAALAPGWARAAMALDPTAGFPGAALDQLRALGALMAPLPTSLGGLGLGTHPSGALGLLALLRWLGRGNLALGRIFEGHVNALQLVARYGSPPQLRDAAEDAAAGRLFAIWATDGPTPVTLGRDQRLCGGKAFCSAAAYAARPLITATLPDGSVQMLLVPLTPGRRTAATGPDMHGMRGCGTAAVDFSGIDIPPARWIGARGDYLREPAFSGGAWRAAAVALGGLDALVVETKRQLVARGRHNDPHQLARIGALLVAQETASLWAARAAGLGESNSDNSDAVSDVTGYVNLARTAIERVCLEAISLSQRCLGLAAFARGNPAELIYRDLATYLRQPAPDEALTEAAAWFATRDLPAPGACG